jgi:DNA-binding transcriptional LysR family regulator
MNFRQIDLNLLHVFDAVMKHRSVTLASEQLALSPSAVSHALARLRQALKDDLFVRDEAGLQPTARAMELASQVSDGLALLERALAAAPFVPSESIRRFRLAAGDYVCAMILPRLVQRLAQVAPHVDLQVTPVSRLDVARQLDVGAVDVIIGLFRALPEKLRRRTLMQERVVFAARRDHPLTRDVVTREKLFDFPHVVVELTGATETRGDGFLDDRGLVRRVWMDGVVLEARDQANVAARVAVSVPHFTSVAPLLRVSDMVATMPLRLAQQAVAQGGIALLDPSLMPDPVAIEMVWHSRGDGDAGLAWLLDELVLASTSAE